MRAVQDPDHTLLRRQAEHYLFCSGTAGKAPIDYFQQLSLEGMPALAEGANRADWIIELTTEVTLWWLQCKLI